MDRDAVEAGFDLGARFAWRPATTGPWMIVDRVGGVTLLDGRDRPGWRARHRAARWWQVWREGPRTRVRLS